MKLRTSYFNVSVLKKDITRFAPLWGLYTVFTVLFVMFSAMDREAVHFANNASDIMAMMGVINFIYGGLCALLLFGDLFNSRLCNALHAMPMRREGWFLTHTAAGMLMCIVPNTVGALLASLYLGPYCYLAFLWLAVVVLEFLFFFGVGVFSAMCVGNKLGMVAVYCLINFFAMLAGALIDCFYLPVFYGMVFDMEVFSRCCPVYSFTSQFVMTEYDNMTDFTRFIGFVPEDWRYLGIAAAVGAVALMGAGLLYRQRKLECAGDFIAVKPAAYAFLILYSLGVAAVLYTMNPLFLPVGMGIGFFTGRMLLERKVNVFRGRNFLGYGLLLGGLLVTVILTFIDPLGFTRYVPQAEQVKNVSISPYFSYYYWEDESMRLEDRGDVEQIVDIHRELALNRSYGIEPEIELPLCIRYEMENGTVIKREYYLAADSESGQTLKQIYSREEAVLCGYDAKTLLAITEQLEFTCYDGSLPYIAFTSKDGTQDQSTLRDKYPDQGEKIFTLEGSIADSAVVQGLMEAIAKDCREGNMAQYYQFHVVEEKQNYERIGTIMISGSKSRYEDVDINISVYSDCYYTLNYLKTLAES